MDALDPEIIRIRCSPLPKHKYEKVTDQVACQRGSNPPRFAPGFFPPQCRINSLAICSMLNLEAVISTVFATFWNHFYANCSILELETDRKSRILELETLISAGIGIFGAGTCSSLGALGLVQLVLLGLLWCAGLVKGMGWVSYSRLVYEWCLCSASLA